MTVGQLHDGGEFAADPEVAGEIDLARFGATPPSDDMFRLGPQLEQQVAGCREGASQQQGRAGCVEFRGFDGIHVCPSPGQKLRVSGYCSR
jgi:hypothetical protein